MVPLVPLLPFTPVNRVVTLLGSTVWPGLDRLGTGESLLLGRPLLLVLLITVLLGTGLGLISLLVLLTDLLGLGGTTLLVVTIGGLLLGLKSLLLGTLGRTLGLGLTSLLGLGETLGLGLTSLLGLGETLGLGLTSLLRLGETLGLGLTSLLGLGETLGLVGTLLIRPRGVGRGLIGAVIGIEIRGREIIIPRSPTTARPRCSLTLPTVTTTLRSPVVTLPLRERLRLPLLPRIEETLLP